MPPSNPPAWQLTKSTFCHTFKQQVSFLPLPPTLTHLMETGSTNKWIPFVHVSSTLPLKGISINQFTTSYISHLPFGVLFDQPVNNFLSTLLQLTFGLSFTASVHALPSSLLWSEFQPALLLHPRSLACIWNAFQSTSRYSPPHNHSLFIWIFLQQLVDPSFFVNTYLHFGEIFNQPITSHHPHLSISIFESFNLPVDALPLKLFHLYLEKPFATHQLLPLTLTCVVTCIICKMCDDVMTGLVKIPSTFCEENIIKSVKYQLCFKFKENRCAGRCVRACVRAYAAMRSCARLLCETRYVMHSHSLFLSPPSTGHLTFSPRLPSLSS